MEEDIIKLKKEKIEELKNLKINPYPYKYITNSDSETIKKENSKLNPEEKTNKEVRIAGRIISLRPMGKASFGNLRDFSGDIQFYTKEDEIGGKKYNIFKKLIDIGDIIGIEGTIFRTKMGEISVRIKDFELLTKSLRTLPEKWHGLQDTEIRYRQRYLDLIANPKIRKVFELRAKIIDAIREYFKKEGYLEVETPILQPVYGGGFAKPFVTHSNALNCDLYLRIANEMYLKRLIVGGFKKVFEFSVDFRNEDIDADHNPEFLSVEAMTAYEDYIDGIKRIIDIISSTAKKVLGTTKIDYLGKKLDLAKWNKLTMKESIKKYAKLDVDKLSESEIRNIAQKNRIEVLKGASKGKIIGAIFDELVQSKLIQPTIIYDYPIETSPLAKRHRKEPELAERFEMFICGREFGNNYTEITDASELRKNLETLRKLKEEREGEYHPLDEDFILTIEYGMPPTCGIAIGIDRLVMLLTNSPSIKEVILFPQMKPEKEDK